jgi:hypothetical protein
MGTQAAVVLYVLALVSVVVGVDVLFFRNQLWARLIVNAGIVLVFAAFYLRFLKAQPLQCPLSGQHPQIANCHFMSATENKADMLSHIGPSVWALLLALLFGPFCLSC